jgi:hypothetical protein
VFLPPLWLLALQAPPLSGAPVIPKYGYSVPAKADAAELAGVAADCGGKGRLVVLPPVSGVLGGAAVAPEPQTLGALAGAVPPGAEVYVRLRLATGGLAQGGPETEKLIAAQVDQIVSRLPLGEAAVRGLVVELEEPLPAPELFQFALASLSVKAKGSKENLQVVLSFPAGFLQKHGDLVKGVVPYADAFGTDFAPGWQTEAAWIADHALNKPVFLKVSPDGDAGELLASRYLDAVVAASGTSVEAIWTGEAESASTRKVCAAASFLAKFITPDFTLMGEAVSPIAISVPGAGPQKLYAAGRTPNVVLLGKIGATRGAPKTIDLRGAGEQIDVEWYDPIAGVALNAGTARKTTTETAQSGTSDSDYLLLLVKKGGAAEQTVYSGATVSEKVELRADEVVARWQRYKEAQRQVLANYLATVFMNLHFEPANMGSGFDISIEFRQFSKRDTPTEWVQTGFYVNGVKFKKRAEFPLPQLEPEKVLTQPLDLRLNEKYSYKMLGMDQVNGVTCYLLGVEPAEANESLYSGKIWIDAKTFRQVKVNLRQTGSKGNVVANQETQVYELVPDAKGQVYNLLKSTYAQQTLNAAGRNFILQKTYTYSDFATNAPDFDAQLQAARQSDKPMFRDTEAGLRGLKKEGDERVEEPGEQKRIRSIVTGALYDGSFNYPIPLLGYSLVDFDFHHSGAQLSLFWAGPLLAANLSKQYGTKFRLGLDVAASGLPQNNRIYSGNTEIKDQGLWMFEESTGARATWQATNSLSFTGATYLVYDLFAANSDTNSQYVLPHDGVTIEPGLEVKYAHSGYILSSSFYEGLRLGWRGFGLPSSPEAVNKDWYKYSGDFSKSFYFGKFTKSGLDLAYYGGQHLDRFSRYEPSFFSEPRIRGIPSGTDSFDNVAVATVSHGFNIMDLIKFEAFYNHAWAQNQFESSSYRAFDGLEFEFGTAGPMGTYLQGIMTYALKGDLARYKSRFGVYFLILKPLK